MIWKYSDKFRPQIKSDYQLSIDEGETPLDSFPEFARSIGLNSLYLKREDKNPTGSHKDRGLAYQISAHLQKGQDEFVISSSGNAAISAIKCVQKAGAKLHVYLSHNLPISKIERLNKTFEKELLSQHLFYIGSDLLYNNIAIHIVARPKVEAFRFAKKNNIPFIRGSTDEIASEGFKTIAFEIYEKVPEIDSIFIPCSSGTTAEGIYDGFQIIREELPEEDSWQIPQLHIVQTAKVNTIAREFDKDFTETKTSLAQAIVDRVGHRKSEIIKHIIDTDGFGWVVSDEWIKKGTGVLQSLGVNCSAEGGAAMGALLKALEKGWQIDNPVVVITGK